MNKSQYKYICLKEQAFVYNSTTDTNFPSVDTYYIYGEHEIGNYMVKYW